MGAFYTPDEADAILAEALKKQPLPGDMSRDQLEAVAAEMGISPDDLAQAEAEWRSVQEIEPSRTELMQQQQRLRVLLVVPLSMFIAATVGGVGGAPSLMIFVAAAFFVLALVARIGGLRRDAFRTEEDLSRRRLRLRERLGLPRNG